MFMLFLSLFVAQAWDGEEENMHLIVRGSRYEEIYMEPVKIVCEEECTYKNDLDSLFVAANTHHHLWFRAGKISAIYNKDTITLNYPDCDFAKDPIGCSSQNGLWILKSTITLDTERATLNLMLMDPMGAMLGQSSYIRHKKSRIVHKSTTARQKDPYGQRPTIEVETVEPVIIEVPPVISEKDIHQAMMMLYDSVRK